MILIIAYGNSLRRDDGAGHVLAEILEGVLRERGFEVQRESVHQLTPELAEWISGEEVSAVVFVDACVIPRGRDDFKVEASLLTSPEDSSPSMGHYFNPEVLMAYARYLYSRQPTAWLLTVPGVDFDHGEGLSEIASSALAAFPELLRSLPEEWPLLKSS